MPLLDSSPPDMPPRILPRKRFGGEASGSAGAGALPACSAAAGAGPPLAVAAARCNRCGACLRLGCGAISDAGGEALVIDAALCAGGGVCAPLCRARAILPGGAMEPGPPVHPLAPGQPHPAAPPLARS